MGNDRRNVSPLSEGIQLGGAIAAVAGLIYAVYTHFSSRQSTTTYRETNYTSNTHTTENAYEKVTTKTENNQMKETHTSENIREISNKVQFGNRNNLSHKNNYKK
uniref:Uncharacterized protein n=1 Tax=Octopus bimaculoides TaxID=37653 RepID=A0A0L8FQ67_OCTBM